MQLSLMLHSQPVLKTEVDLNQRDWFKMGSVTADFSLFGKLFISFLRKGTGTNPIKTILSKT